YVIHYNRGIALATVGQIGEAEQEFRQATQLNSNFAPAFAAIGAILGQPKRPNAPEPSFRQRLKLSADAFQHALKLDPNQPVALTEFGHLLVLAGQPDNAISHFKRAIELLPRLAHAHYGLGLALEAKMDAAGAEAAYKEALKLDPKRYPD